MVHAVYVGDFIEGRAFFAAWQKGSNEMEEKKLEVTEMQEQKEETAAEPVSGQP